jgi:hypothetical protein
MGGLHWAFQTAAAGTNLDTMLAALDDGACPVEHWGYVFSGAMRVEYNDGHSEVLSAGDIFHVLPGHRPYMVEDTVLLQVSRAAAHEALLAQVETAALVGEP